MEQESRKRAAIISTRALKRLTRETLRAYVRPVVRMGRALFPDDAQLLATLRMPRARDPERVSAVALGLADAIAPHAKQLTDAGFPEDFVSRLRAAAQALKQALDERAGEVGLRRRENVGTRRHAHRREVQTVGDMVELLRAALT